MNASRERNPRPPAIIDWSIVQWNVYEKGRQFRVEGMRMHHHAVKKSRNPLSKKIAGESSDRALKASEIAPGERFLFTVAGVSRRTVGTILKTHGSKGFHDRLRQIVEAQAVKQVARMNEKVNTRYTIERAN